MTLNIILCVALSAYLHASSVIAREAQPKPNIVIILADDLGWNDVGFHDARMFATPNIDALAYNGIILNKFYSNSLCTPSRSALMTGKFPIFTGMQHYVIADAQPWGLPLELKTLPQHLKQAGYHTHLVGKWHLGFFSRNYTPNYRGFDSFFGFWQGHQDYFTHRARESHNTFDGYDLHENQRTYEEPQGIYGTDLYTMKAVDVINKHDPSKPLFLQLAQIATHGEENPYRLQAPEEEIRKFAYIKDPVRRTFAAVVSKLDESVGHVVHALRQKKMLQNSIIMFMADNGAPTVGLYATTGSNHPFRGIKATELEGGTRLAAAIWSPLIKHKQRVSDAMMHMVDVLPTLCAAAGINLQDAHEPIDGLNMWDVLQNSSQGSPRSEFPYNIDPEGSKNSSGAIRDGDWKYYKGNNIRDELKDWLGTEYGTVLYSNISDNHDIVLTSAVNLAIASLSNESTTFIPDNSYTPLTAEKIRFLKNEAKVTCTLSEETPLCDVTGECLFNLKNDPCERYNLAEQYPRLHERMKRKFEAYRVRVVPPRNKPRDERANPDLYGGEWVNWHDYWHLPEESSSVRGVFSYISTVVAIVLIYIRNFLSSLFRQHTI